MICPNEILECWETSNEVQLADAKNYYTKAQIDEKIDDIEVSGVTEEKAEEMIDNALEGYYSKGETDDLIGGLEEVDATISGAVDSLDETVDGMSNKVQTLYSELSERAVTSSFAADVQSDYIDLQFTYKSGWGEDEDSEIKYVELPSATTQKAGVMSASDKTKLDNTYTKVEVDAKDAAIEGKIPSLDGYATEAFVSNYTYDKTTIDEKIEEGGGFIPENYYTKTDVDGLVSDLEAADSIISGAVDNLSSGLATEAQRAQNAEAAISGAIPSVDGYFDGVEYDSSTKRINFKHGGTVKTYIDATDFIKDGMVSNVEIVGNNLVITFNSDAGHETITIPLTDIFNPNNYYTKTEVDTKDAAVEAKIPSLVGYATENWVSGYTYDKQTIEDMIEEGGSFIPEDYYDKAATDALLAAKANTANTYTKTEVDDLIPDISGKQDISGMTAYTTTSTTNVLSNTVTAHTADTNVHVTASEKTTWNNKSDFSGDYNDLTNKPTIPSYTAGSGITISSNVISAKIWSGTKTEYDALTTKDSDTIYLIYNE